MSRAKSKKDNVKLEENTREEKTSKPKKVVKPVVSFDAYFQGLLSKREVMAHHKAPMRLFAEARGLKSGTLEEFDKLFKSY